MKGDVFCVCLHFVIFTVLFFVRGMVVQRHCSLGGSCDRGVTFLGFLAPQQTGCRNERGVSGMLATAPLSSPYNIVVDLLSALQTFEVDRRLGRSKYCST